MEQWLTTIVAIIGSVFASSGFWVFMQKRAEKHDVKAQMILGLGHDRLVFLCTKYTNRGYITHDELENLHEYLYTPYVALGGNGTVTRLMKRVDSLPIRKTPFDNEDGIDQ